MCGIIGYSGPLDASKILLDGLSGLEYRGYDSAGIGLCMEDTSICIAKKVGKVKNLREYCAANIHGTAHSGIGHTRWATHGGVTDTNAHPHRAGKVTLIHNGIIENYHELTEQFHLEGQLVSQTDSEVAARVLDALYDGDPLKAIQKLQELIVGSYGFCILFDDQPGSVYAIRRVSPLVASYTHAGAIIASDLTALIPYSNQYFVVPEDKIVRLTPYKVHVYNMDENFTKVYPEIMTVNWNMDAAMKNGYPHFMMKEIHEQPRAVRDTLSPRIKENESGERYIDLSETGLTDEDFAAVSRVYLIGCGSAYHVGMAARYVLEKAARVPCEVDLASEFRYRDPILEESGLVIIISQSGETADSLAALRLCKERAVDPYDLELDAGKLALILQLLGEGKIDRAGARNTLEAVFADDADVEAYIKKEKLAIERDETAVAGAIAQVLAENADAVEKFRAGNEKVMGFLTGQCMKLLRGKADPKQVSAALLEALR